MISRRLFTSTLVSACSGLPGATMTAFASNRTAEDIPFYLFDTFTKTALTGKPAPVAVLKEWLPDATMQALAAEMNQSEVAFILKQAGDWHIRWFAQVREVPLNGSITLAAAALIFEQLEPDRQSLTFLTRTKGPLHVTRDGSSYLMDFPPDDDPAQRDIADEIEADLGVRPVEVWVNGRNILIYRNTAEIAAIRSKLTRETKWADGKHVIVTAPGSDGIDYVLRYFAPLLNIPEDPVTGVIHCTLAPFWARRLGKTSFRVRQLSARGGEVATAMRPDGRVLIGGPAIMYMQGRLRIPV